jgi:hypothetical protein
VFATVEASNSRAFLTVGSDVVGKDADPSTNNILLLDVALTNITVQSCI